MESSRDASSPEQPDPPFHDFRASKSVAWRSLTTQISPRSWYQGSKILKSPIGKQCCMQEAYKAKVTQFFFVFLQLFVNEDRRSGSLGFCILETQRPKLASQPETAMPISGNWAPLADSNSSYSACKTNLKKKESLRADLQKDNE